MPYIIREVLLLVFFVLPVVFVLNAKDNEKSFDTSTDDKDTCKK